MKMAFYILATWTMATGLAAILMRNLIRCALALIGFFAGIAGLFFTLRAEFLGAVQLVVYVGAIAVLILFAIMLTRHVTGEFEASPFSRGRVAGWLISGLVGVALIYSIFSLTPFPNVDKAVDLTVANMGQALVTRFAVPFEVVSLLLTAALVGAVVIALDEPRGK